MHQTTWGSVGRIVLAGVCVHGCASPPEASTAATGGTVSRPVMLGDRLAPQQVWRPAGARWRTDAAGYAAEADAAALRMTLGNGAPDAPGGAVTLRTLSVAGDTVSGEAVPGDAGRVTIDRGAAVEGLRALPAGIEQSWTFVRPPLRGVEVRVGIEGMDFAGSSPEGLRFVPRGGAGVALRYGHGTWVDAAGHRTAVEARWTGEDVVLTVPSAVVAETVFPAALDPLVGPAVAVDPAVHGHYSPSVDPAGQPMSLATNGSVFLAVWTDLRTGTPGYPWATRIGPDGTLLDLGGFQLAPGGPPGEPPALASDGRDFLAVWNNGVARVSGSGTVLGTGAVGVGTNEVASASPLPPGLAFDGVGYITAWAGSSGVHALRLDAMGHPLDSAPITVATGPAGGASVAASSTGYLVTWDDRGASDIRFARLSRAGALLDPAPRPVSLVAASRSLPVATSDGTNYYLAWKASVGSGSRPAGIYGTLLSPTGAPVGAAATYFGFASDPGTSSQLRPAVVFDGTSFLVARAQGYAVAAYRVDRTGTVLDATPHLSPATMFSSRNVTAAGSARTGFAVGGMSEVVLFNPDGTPHGPLVEACSVGDAQTQARVASAGDDFLVTWFDQEGPYLGPVFAARVTSSLAVLDVPPVQVVPFGDQPGVISDGTRYLLSTGSDTIPMSPAGTLGTLSAVSDLGRLAAYGAGVFLWLGSDRTTNHLVARRYHADGTPMDPLSIPLPGPGYGPVVSSAAAWGGTGFLVAWADPTGPCRIGAERLDAAGDLLDATPIGLLCGASATTPLVLHVDVAFDGASYLIVYDNYPTITYRGRGVIQAQRVRPTGEVLDATPLQLSVATTGQQTPAVAYDGHTFVVVWADGTAGAGDIVGTRVRSDGTVVDVPPLGIAVGPTAETAPSLAVNRRGQALVLYDRFDLALYAQRLEARLVAFADGVVVDAGAPLDAGASLDAGARDVAVPTDVPPDLPAVPSDSGSATPEAGMAADVPRTDASTPPTDAPTPDAGGPLADAGASPADAGTPTDAADAGTPADVTGADVLSGDAGSPEVATVDAATDVDAGVDADAGGGEVAEAGAGDGGVADAGTPAPSGGGGLCAVRPGAVSRSPGLGWMALGVGLVVARRRRRRDATV